MPNDTYSIGKFAQVTGLSEKQLRTYHARDLLVPAVDPRNGYRIYSENQTRDAQIIRMLRRIDMPLSTIATVLESSPTERSRIVGEFWYAAEESMHDSRQTVSDVRSMAQQEDGAPSYVDEAMVAAHSAGAFAAIQRLAAIEDHGDAATAYGEAVKEAYWTDKDLHLATALTYAGVARMYAIAESGGALEAETSFKTVKTLLYNLASFTWVGWDEEGITIEPAMSRAGLDAARSHLAIANELNVDALARSRAEWMLGAHLLTSGDASSAADVFVASSRHADEASAEAEQRLRNAFGALAHHVDGAPDSGLRLERSLSLLREVEQGDAFVAQVKTCQAVLGV